MNKKEERTTCLIPCTMLPSKQTFMDLGFTFREIGGTDLCLATLPEGWKSVAGKDFVVTLIDEKDRERGAYIYEPGCNICISLKTRFYVSVESDPNDSTKAFRYVFVRDRVNGGVLFSTGSSSSKDIVKISMLTVQAKTSLYERYPDWEDPAKYWDLDEKDIKYWCQ